MLPALPGHTTPELDELLLRVPTSSAALGKGIHPLILEEIARLMSLVNSYYTNAMEGNPSKLTDIDNALRRKFARDQSARYYQLEHVAHIQVQEAMMQRLRAEPTLRICSAAFLSWLHAQFFLGLPEKMRVAKTRSGTVVPIVPGALRDRGVTVGRHEGPSTRQEIQQYLDQFEELLRPEGLHGTQKLLGMASAHHRFLWIHPFPEGNGRVARLLTTAYGFRIGVGEHLLWTVTRAFARQRAEYDAQLARADQLRRNDWDGRGPLSEEGLLAFCTYFLACCADQIRFMDGMLQLDELERRYRLWLRGRVAAKQLSKAGARVMERLLLQGEVPRAHVLEICSVQQRRATQIIRGLLDAEVVHSPSTYGPLRLRIVPDMVAVLFPALV